MNFLDLKFEISTLWIVYLGWAGLGADGTHLHCHGPPAQPADHPDIEINRLGGAQIQIYIRPDDRSWRWLTIHS